MECERKSGRVRGEGQKTLESERMFENVREC